METGSSRGPAPLNGSDAFYRRIVFDMMMASQYNQTRTPYTSPISKTDIMDNAPEACDRESLAQEFDGRNWWGAYCNLETDTEYSRPSISCTDSGYQQPQKHRTHSHHLLEKTKLSTFPQPITHRASLESHNRVEALRGLGSSGIPRWMDEHHNEASTNPEELIIHQKSRIGHGLDLCREVSLPYSVPKPPALSVKEDSSFPGITKPTKEEAITTTTMGAKCSSSVMLSDPLGVLSKDIGHTTKSTQDFEYDWAALSSVGSLDSAPPIADTLMQSTAALKNIDGCWWGDRNYRLGERVWGDMNDSLTNLIMTQRNPPADLIGNVEQFQSSYDSQCSPISSFSSNGFTPDPVTLAPREVENFPEELSKPYGLQQSTIFQVDQTSNRYMQVAGSANMTSRADGGCRDIRKKAKGKLAAQRNNAKDAFLVRSKRAGMSYKEIKERGCFSEAESTLRGRFRTLTKRKEHRVRKPEWENKDLQLLCEAVARYTQPIEQTRKARGYHKLEEPLDVDFKCPRIPWKLVGQYIWNNGGSYHFGNATCKKKWGELQDNNSLMWVKGT